MIVCITGTPGTGKTTVCKNLPWPYINLNEFAKENNCIKGYDKKRKVRIVDMDCLKDRLKNLNNIILESHYSHFMNCDVVVVLRTSPSILKIRLFEKGFDDEKIRENLEAEALGIITQEAMDYQKNVYEIDTGKFSLEETVNIIKDILNGRGEDFKAGKIDYLNEVMEWY